MEKMIYDKRLGDLLVQCGLLIAIFLGFEAFSGAVLKIGRTISLDSTYIVAFVDAGIIYLGMVIRSSKKLDNYSGRVGSRMDVFKVGIILFLAFLLCGYLILCAIPNVPWDSVYWFDPPLNFRLIRDYFQNNLYVSLILVLVLSVVLFIAKTWTGTRPGASTHKSF